MKPLLPTYDKLVPYLKKIDENRYYSNSGPLVLELERRLGELFNNQVITASSATSALTAVLISFNLLKGSFVACPSWTFVATPAAIVAAGYVPYFYDTIPPDSVSAIVLVAPFGAPIDIPHYDVPVVIDAAAGFDNYQIPCEYPVVISTHATKAFATGEGGFVVGCNVRSLLNFGLPDGGGINGKMSEYHAAVGLAELDNWPNKRQRWKRIMDWYGQPFISSTVVKNEGIGTRPRYGVHNLPAYKHFPRTSMEHTEELMRTMIQLPCWIGMDLCE